ncbi:uncharacterized protein E0L32_003153 [Thyridium curvatum]|uniref:Uncharacterized protein n=1 Tax=Thyridium curvatum TaxID=1093900 RepID=A0A507BLE9_9PEZI|nr:uncharacterized protein E0L32_003153 [Thyridium curvatum]TPX17510.1 hypothetical protein E0L32_003153 [Thyridium curvatum]
MLPPSSASASLPPHRDPFPVTFLKHQFRPHNQPSLAKLFLHHRVAVVTGANSGIGLECARLLLSLGLSRLILAVRSREAGESEAAPLRQTCPNIEINVWHLDLNLYGSVWVFAPRCEALPRLDIAIPNASIMNSEFRVSPTTGHEETLQVNYLSTALLALLLLPTLEPKHPGGGPGRLTLVCSGASVTMNFPEKDAAPLITALDDSTGWDSAVAKERCDVTKLLLLMFMQKPCDIIVGPDAVIINAVDPGFTQRTGLFRSLSLPVKVACWLPYKLFAASPERGGHGPTLTPLSSEARRPTAASSGTGRSAREFCI